MATPMTPKSILKKGSYPAATTSKADRDRDVALYHANLIQERKDIELNILLSTETLIDYPLAGDPYNASNPSPSDAQTFKALLRQFQPSDYDALILERNINEHCGYTLCPKPRIKDGAEGKYRLVGTSGKAKDFKVVERAELEKWCSDACARRALYVRVQLSERPAWERETINAVDVDLLDEPKSEQDLVADAVGKMDLHGSAGTENKQKAADLAWERGDQGFATRNGLVHVNIQEKEVPRPPEAPSIDTVDLSGRLDSMHLTLEGHTSSFGSQRQKRHQEELDGAGGEETNGDEDWNL